MSLKLYSGWKIGKNLLNSYCSFFFFFFFLVFSLNDPLILEKTLERPLAL